jgi:AcrR family transcriptional regulator
MLETKSKILENKEEKERKILDASFALFTEKGIKNTSIQQIVDKAGIAKGTFYLYFKDKDDLQEYLITKKSEQLFNDALKYVNEKNISDFTERLINMIDFIIDEFIRDKSLLQFISKNLSLGLFGDKLSNLVDKSTIGVMEAFKKGIEENKLSISNPELTLYMIIELTSSVVFTSITMNKPLPISELKPFLYDKLRKILLD